MSISLCRCTRGKNAYTSAYIFWPCMSKPRNQLTLLRLIPTMTFNSSHLAFCLANLLAFYLAFYFDILSAIWHSIWHILWQSICHIFWHSIWHIYLTCHLAYLLTFYLAYLLIFYLAYLLTYIRHSFWHILWHSIWHTFWHSIWHSIWHSLWHSIWLCFWPLRSGWGPVEVRRGPRHAESRRLRSGEAHSAPNFAGWGPARPTAIESWQWRSGEAHCNQELADEVRREGGRIKEEEGGGRRKTTLTGQVGNKCLLEELMPPMQPCTAKQNQSAYAPYHADCAPACSLTLTVTAWIYLQMTWKCDVMTCWNRKYVNHNVFWFNHLCLKHIKQRGQKTTITMI